MGSHRGGGVLILPPIASYEPSGGLPANFLASLRFFSFGETSPAQWAELVRLTSDARHSRTVLAAHSIAALGAALPSLLAELAGPFLRALGVNDYCAPGVKPKPIAPPLSTRCALTRYTNVVGVKPNPTVPLFLAYRALTPDTSGVGF